MTPCTQTGSRQLGLKGCSQIIFGSTALLPYVSPRNNTRTNRFFAPKSRCDRVSIKAAVPCLRGPQLNVVEGVSPEEVRRPLSWVLAPRGALPKMTCGLITNYNLRYILSQSSAPSAEESVLFLCKCVENVEAWPIESGPISRALAAKQRSVSPSEARVKKKSLCHRQCQPRAGCCCSFKHAGKREEAGCRCRGREGLQALDGAIPISSICVKPRKKRK